MSNTPVSSPATVLIVEDEPKLAALLLDYLKAAGHRGIVVSDGLQAVPAVREHQPALLLLDLMLPGQDGISICREVRSFSQLPILMMTARVEEVDRLLGLEVGADDYICKPYSPRELMARVQAQLRRQQWHATGPAAAAEALAGVQIDEMTQRASHAGQPLDLTPAEYRLLRALLLQPGRVFSRDQLLDHLHDDARALTDRTVDSHIRNLRRKLEAATDGVDPIRSVYGVGYAWEWPA